ncbi:GNAT family N-acetyltransferase [uncultured Corynebacterium sp.]|uniref:GNAT family N-acetyltransferase n=1 Tax=uncultured Corynebacterium sp. TaxID=159447 RepID=UPI0025D78D26|nr:GNAT family N-acetyltransferase [uncultured Corynebacterium sp.]
MTDDNRTEPTPAGAAPEDEKRGESTDDSRRIEVRDEFENNRFALIIDDEYAGFANYEKFTGMRDFTHTEILGAFEGQGLSKVLIKEALDQAVSAGDEIVVTCPAVRRFIRKNPAYREHVRES